MAYILKADGTTETGIAGEAAHGSFSLEQMQKAVAGYIEGVPGTNNRAWCNEEGRLMGLPVNANASLLFRQSLCGDVLVMDEGDRYEGDEEEDRETDAPGPESLE